MSAEENRATVVRYFEENHNHRNLAIMDELCTLQHAASYKEWQRRELAALPNTHFTIGEVVAEGDWVVLRWTIPVTHQGNSRPPVAPVFPRRIHNQFERFILYRLENGKIAQEWHFRDRLDLLRQFDAEVQVDNVDLRNEPTAES